MGKTGSGLTAAPLDESEVTRTIESLQAQLTTALARERRLTDILQGMHFGVVTVHAEKDGHFRILSVNSTAEQLDGIRAPEVLGRRMMDVFPYIEKSGLHDVLQSVARDGKPSTHQTRLYRDGRLSHCHNDHVFRLSSGEIVIVYYDSTERTRTEEEMRRYAHAIEQSRDGICLTDLNGLLVFANKALADMHGRAHEELLGAHIRIFHTPDQYLNEVQPIWESVHKEGTYSGELNRVRADGTTFPSFMSLTEFHDTQGRPIGLLAHVRDITQQRRHEERLRLLMTAVQESRNGIVITDAQLERPGPHIVFANEGFTRITGFMAHEVIGQNPRILQGARTDPDVLKSMTGALRAGQAWTGQTYNYRKDGTEFLMEWHVSPIHDSYGRVTHYVAIQQDVTEREQAEAAQHRAEQLETITRTAVTYHHEINNPLAAIAGHAQLLLRDEKDPERKESLESILRAASRIEEVTKRVQNISQLAFTTYIGESQMLDLKTPAAGFKITDNK